MKATGMNISAEKDVDRKRTGSKNLSLNCFKINIYGDFAQKNNRFYQNLLTNTSIYVTIQSG